MLCSLPDPEKTAARLSPCAESPMNAEALAGMRSFAEWLITAALADCGAL